MNKSQIMRYALSFLIAIMIFQQSIYAQLIKNDSVVERPARPAFESSYIIENPTNEVLSKESMEIQLKHRFGLVNGGDNDLVGIWAPSNIRLGIAYGIHDRITLGFGTTKFDRLQDFNWKLALFRQTRSGKKPISISYYGNFTIDARSKENFELAQDRFSFFHQIILARRFGPNVSFQVAPSISHYNLVESGMKNDRFGIALGGRIKISPQTAILLDYSQPLGPNVDENSMAFDPKAGIAVGFEFSTLGHAFQLFITNYNGIVPQKNYVFNQNDFFKGEFLIGFNITRIYNF